MDDRKLSDTELLAGLLQRRPEAFRQLVERRKHQVLNICYRFVHNAEDAEDIAQETFVEVYRSIASFRKSSSLQTWIYRIAVTRSLNFIRNQKRLKRGGAVQEISRDAEGAAELPGPAIDDPHQALEQKERRQVLAQALDRLPQNQRIAFILSKYEEISHQDIAGILGTTVASVEALVHRAKTNLQKRLSTYYRGASQKSA
ncbi:MAG: RNA polymerase sigma factor [candidate division Zixibacteria bacterium]|nr:RNA polymerase sigma factor [candidate division Zixibacteria bacterium]